jgi:hypothetical protein
MLEKLDTLIAFAVVMLGLSLIITVLTQIIATFLGLRGSNLLWGIETLFNKLAPTLNAAGLPPLQLAKDILQDRSISDSTFSRAGDMWVIGPLVNGLSKFWPGNRIIPRWRYATAIRPEELVRAIHDKIDSLAAGHPAIQILSDVLAARDQETDRRLQMLNAALQEIRLPSPAATGPNYAVQVDKILQQVTDAAQQSVGKLDTWFSSVMDRVAQRFAVQVRFWTVVFAFLVAFGAHLDSLHLLDQLTTNPENRAALVNIRDGMLGEAKTLLPPPAGAAAAAEAPISPEILNEALSELKNKDAEVPGTAKIPADTTNVTDAVTSLTQQGVPAAVGDEYRKTVIGVLRKHADTIEKDLLKTGVLLIPRPYPGILTFEGRRNFLGILLAAAALSLGAPFWYNALKNLSNLRTVVANKEQQESSGT